MRNTILYSTLGSAKKITVADVKLTFPTCGFNYQVITLKIKTWNTISDHKVTLFFKAQILYVFWHTFRDIIDGETKKFNEANGNNVTEVS